MKITLHCHFVTFQILHSLTTIYTFYMHKHRDYLIALHFITIGATLLPNGQKESWYTPEETSG